MLSETSQKIYDIRRNHLRYSQIEFANYLNQSPQIKRENFTQSTISKYESGEYKIPADILLHCIKLERSKYSKKEYSKQKIIEKILSLDEKNDALFLHTLGLLCEQKTMNS